MGAAGKLPSSETDIGLMMDDGVGCEMVPSIDEDARNRDAIISCWNSLLNWQTRSKSVVPELKRLLLLSNELTVDEGNDVGK